MGIPIKVTQNDLGKVVSAKELHEFLEVEMQLLEWEKLLLEHGLVNEINVNSIGFLDLICALGYKFKSISQNQKLISLLSLYAGSYLHLKDAVFTHLCWFKLSCQKNEFDLHKKFKQFHKELIPNSKIITHKLKKGHIPDFWIEVDGEKCPVEIKLKKIDSTALKQIERYIEVYECKKGFVVAPKLDCKLPNNIFFVELSLKDDIF